MAPIQPSQEELDRINAETVTNVTSTDFPGHWPGEDNSWSLPSFRKTFKINIHHNDPLESSFSLVGIDAAVANAFRRIMIAEIPSVAIEAVFVHNNTSVIQDEVLCQRLGLVPFKGGKEGIQQFLKWHPRKKDDGMNTVVEEEEEENTKFDYNTIILSLKIACTRNREAEKGERDPLKAYHNAHVYARDIQFKPFGRQEQYFSGEDAIRPTNPDILVAKLRPGQCIDVDMHAFKGVGSDHAKFSPVATASYRLLPTITIVKPILGKDAEKFARCFPQGVIGLEKVDKKEAQRKGSGYEGHEGEIKAVVVDPMKDTVSRECLRHEEFEGKVKLGRVRDHFIFSVESVGQWESDALFLESVKVLKTKCEALKQNLQTMNR
ncbi:DNA-directed RNA polymerases I and III subunit RPAC1 [Lachnellula arida]|uniref:DNA-directed RNA polymerases I and III subunit RPAC1 n=1 Tax=Lachnellula arida TaxID=1316785 RepID=A0A8T9BKV3_9HELO|nr:DNA-directed RNA polymerases I and III subunit RPAC1 [Lachnellula arida]